VKKKLNSINNISPHKRKIMQNKSLHYAQYLSGIISEEQFHEIEQQLHENILRNAIGAGAMALGGLFGGPNNV
jgi:hypothetical protein